MRKSSSEAGAWQTRRDNLIDARHNTSERLRIQLARHGPEPLVAVAGVDYSLLAQPLAEGDLLIFQGLLEQTPTTLEPVQKSVSEWGGRAATV